MADWLLTMGRTLGGPSCHPIKSSFSGATVWAGSTSWSFLAICHSLGRLVGTVALSKFPPSGRQSPSSKSGPRVCTCMLLKTLIRFTRPRHSPSWSSDAGSHFGTSAGHCLLVKFTKAPGQSTADISLWRRVRALGPVSVWLPCPCSLS